MKNVVITASAMAITLLLVTSVLATAHPAFALKKLFACITDASSGGKLSFQDYVDCFNTQFHKQLGNHPASLDNPDVSVTP